MQIFFFKLFVQRISRYKLKFQFISISDPSNAGHADADAGKTEIDPAERCRHRRLGSNVRTSRSPIHSHHHRQPPQFSLSKKNARNILVDFSVRSLTSLFNVKKKSLIDTGRKLLSCEYPGLKKDSEKHESDKFNGTQANKKRL